MPEIALACPFDSGEIIEIAVDQFRKRLGGLSPLCGGKEYGAFEIEFSHTIRLRRVAESAAIDKTTLAWGSVKDGDMKGAGEVVEEQAKETFKSGNPNDERIAHDIPLTVESSDGKGGKIRKKVKYKG